MSLWMHRVSRLWLWIASIVEGCLNNVIASVCVNYHDCTKTIYQLQASKCFKTNVCNTNFVFLFHCSHFTSINANDETAGVCLCLWHWFEQWWQRLVQSYVLMGVQKKTSTQSLCRLTARWPAPADFLLRVPPSLILLLSSTVWSSRPAFGDGHEKKREIDCNIRIRLCLLNMLVAKISSYNSSSIYKKAATLASWTLGTILYFITTFPTKPPSACSPPFHQQFTWLKNDNFYNWNLSVLLLILSTIFDAAAL